MKKLFVTVAIDLLLIIPKSCIAAETQIDSLIKMYSDSNSSLRSRSSLWPVIKLPKDALCNEIIDTLKGITLTCKWYKVVDSKTEEMVLDHVDVLADGKLKYPPAKKQITVVLINTDLGRKLVFMHYEGPKQGWWTSIFTVNEKAEQAGADQPATVPAPKAK